jgi:hypothetical protein
VAHETAPAAQLINPKGLALRRALISAFVKDNSNLSIFKSEEAQASPLLAIRWRKGREAAVLAFI